MYELTLLEDMTGGIDNYREYCNLKGFSEIKECPICSVSIVPNFIGELVVGENLYLLFLCPKCENIFMASYEYKGKGLDYWLELVSIFPKCSTIKEFEEPINIISSMFSKVYNQALEAEAHDLDEIAGMGYRKSLEYLIKDYIIYRNPEKEEEVKTKFLGNCIKELVDNPKIKSMANRAVWLGNDETHYVRKWKDKDVEDLKKLIDLTIYWIMFEMKTEEYEAIMKL